MPELESEAFARRLVTEVDPRWTAMFIEQQHRSVCDYKLILRGAQRGLMEVTRCADPAASAFRAALRHPSKGGPFVPAKRCRYGWWVIPAEGARVDRLRSRIDEYLAAVEAEGIERFFSPTDAGNPAVKAIYQDLQVEFAVVQKWKPPERRILLSEPGRGTIVRAENLSRACSEAAARPDNRRKLGSAPRNHRRLLCVFVESSAYDVWKPLTSQLTPAVAPALPPEISEVWLTARLANTTYLASVDRRRGWVTRSWKNAESADAEQPPNKRQLSPAAP